MKKIHQKVVQEILSQLDWLASMFIDGSAGLILNGLNLYLVFSIFEKPRAQKCNSIVILYDLWTKLYKTSFYQITTHSKK